MQGDREMDWFTQEARIYEVVRRTGCEEIHAFDALVAEGWDANLAVRRIYT